MRIIFLYLLIASIPAFTQVKLEMLPFKASDIPTRVYQGKIVEGKRIRDANGESIVLLCETGVLRHKSDSRYRYARIYAYQFIKKDTGWQQLWKVYDNVEDCSLDVLCEFCKGSLSVTDLDKDGVAECSFVYSLSCKGGLDPDDKKLILYEGKDKFAIRGTNIFEYGNGGKEGGEKRVDKSFNKAPKAFLGHANRHWDQFGTIKL
jgi:hypothetical protein